MVANHWFRQIKKILEAIEITFDATKIRLTGFQLEGDSLVWWDWVKTSRDIKAMTWVKFHELFMGMYFPATTRHAKAREFLELKQGWSEVVHPGQDCGIPPTGYGLYGQDIYGHKERDRGHTEHSRFGC